MNTKIKIDYNKREKEKCNMQMYVVVEVKDGKVIWTDNRLSDTKDGAYSSIKVYNKATKHKRNFSIAQVTNCKLVS